MSMLLMVNDTHRIDQAQGVHHVGNNWQAALAIPAQKCLYYLIYLREEEK